MNNYENFGEKKVALESRPEKGYQTFNEGFFKFENNSIEFIYCIEKSSLDKPSAMAKSYNPQVTTRSATPFWTSVLRLLLLTSGTPVFMLPGVFISAGYLSSSVLLIIVVGFYLHTMHMVLYSAHKISELQDNSVAYSDLLYEALKIGQPRSRWLDFIRALTTAVVSLTWYSVCVFVYLLAAENVTTICNKWFYCQLAVEDTLLILALPVLILCLVSRAEYLESFAAFGFFCNLVALVLVICFVLVDPSPWLLGEANGNSKKPLFIGIMLINISVTPAILLFRRESKSSPKGFAEGVLTVSSIFIFIIYLAYSLVCGLKYGHALPENSISILPPEHVISRVCPIFYGIGLVCIYPHLYCGLLDIISRDIFQVKLEYVSGRLKFWTCGYKILAVLISLLVTYLRPSLYLYLSLGGTVCTTIDSIIYPALVHTIVYYKMSQSRAKFALILIKNFVILVVGLCLVAIGMKDCIWFVYHDK